MIDQPINQVIDWLTDKPKQQHETTTHVIIVCWSEGRS